MNLGLKDRVVLVTGANNPMGIGAATALKFCEEGAKVAVVYKKIYSSFNGKLTSVNGIDRYNKLRFEDCSYIESKMKELTNFYMIIEEDITAKGATARIFDAVENKLGKIEILVNNAAEYEEKKDGILTLDEEIIDKVYNVNVKATLLMIREFVKRSGSYGRIINLSTDAAQIMPGQVTYGSSKAATEAFTRSIAIEVGNKGITVNTVAPGPIQTGYIDEALEKLVLPDIPLNRIGEPEDIANTILFLASEQASWLTGQIIKVSGGHAL